jgi:GntR family transcriptional regulator
MESEPILSTRPVFLQVRDILAQRIAEGRWMRGALLPSEQELARSFKVSVATIRKSLAELEGDGLIRRQQGRGTFVADRLSDDYKAKYDRIRRHDGSRFDWLLLKKDTSPGVASESDAKHLGIRPGANIFHVRRSRRGDRRMFVSEHAIYAEALFPNLDDDLPDVQGIVSLAHAYKIVPGPFVQTIRNVPAGEEFAALAGIAADAPVWELSRTTRDHEGRIIEHRNCLVTPEGCTYWHDM